VHPQDAISSQGLGRRKRQLFSGSQGSAGPYLLHPPATAPQPNLRCLAVPQLVASHLCGDPGTEGLHVVLFKAIRDYLRAYSQAFFTGTKQGAAEAPQQHLVVSRVFFFFFSYGSINVLLEQRDHLQGRQVSGAFSLHATSFCSVLKHGEEKGMRKLKTLITSNWLSGESCPSLVNSHSFLQSGILHFLRGITSRHQVALSDAETQAR